MTDTQHPIWPLPLDNGQLLLTPCPGTKDVALMDSLQQLKAAGARTLITLMTAEELLEYGVADIEQQAAEMGFAWLHLPIEDEAVPDAMFEQQWQQQRSELHQCLQAGGGIAIHCKGGAGRTGLIAARLMLERGQLLEEIIPAIQALRPRAFFFPAQRNYIATVADRDG